MRAIRPRKSYRVWEFLEPRTIAYTLTDDNDKVSDSVTDLDCGVAREGEGGAAGSRAHPAILSLGRWSVCNFLLICKSHITCISYRLQWKAVMYSRTDSRKFKTIS